jgi:transposase
VTKKLPTSKREELDVAYKGCKSAKEQRRIQVVRLLSHGHTHKEVSQIVGFSLDQIKELVTKYNRKGIAGLRLKPHPKNRSFLSDLQKTRIKQLVHKHETPSKAEVRVAQDLDYWSLETLRLLVKQKYHVEYKSRDAYRKLAHRIGMSWQRVEFEDERRSNEKVEEFKKRMQIKLKKGGMSMWW